MNISEAARERDLRSGFAVPPGIDMPGINAVTGGGAGMTPAGFFSLVDTSLTWKGLAQIVEEVDIPVVVKGVHTGADARHLETCAECKARFETVAGDARAITSLMAAPELKVDVASAFNRVRSAPAATTESC